MPVISDDDELSRLQPKPLGEEQAGASLTSEEVEAFSELMAFAAENPESFAAIHKFVSLFFVLRSEDKLRVWKTLSQQHAYAYKEKLGRYTPGTQELIKSLLAATSKEEIIRAYSKQSLRDQQRAEYFMTFQDRIRTAKMLFEDTV